MTQPTDILSELDRRIVIVNDLYQRLIGLKAGLITIRTLSEKNFIQTTDRAKCLEADARQTEKHVRKAIARAFFALLPEKDREEIKETVKVAQEVKGHA